jgi:thiamine-phosphate pyrophosphorylase
VLGATDVAAVLLRLPATDDRSLINQVKMLAPAIQDRGAALLLEGRPDIAVKAGADGAHISNLEEFEAALATLKPDRIVGAGALTTRHDAMQAAERGADYVMFGEMDDRGQRPSFDAILERVAWWSEVFEIPCIGWAESPAEIEPIAKAGADFVAVGEWIFLNARGPVQAITEAAARLALVETDA